VSKFDYALGFEDGRIEGEKLAAEQIADVLDRKLPELFYKWSSDVGAEIVDIIRIKSGE
jgi:hypothetical protein